MITTVIKKIIFCVPKTRGFILTDLPKCFTIHTSVTLIQKERLHIQDYRLK